MLISLQIIAAHTIVAMPVSRAVTTTPVRLCRQAGTSGFVMKPNCERYLMPTSHWNAHPKVPSKGRSHLSSSQPRPYVSPEISRLSSPESVSFIMLLMSRELVLHQRHQPLPAICLFEQDAAGPAHLRLEATSSAMSPALLALLSLMPLP